MKKYYLLLALVCVLGGRVLAQENYQYVGSIDFHGLTENYDGQNQGIVWDDNNSLSSVQSNTPYIDVNFANDTRRVSLHVDDTEYWRIGTSSEIGGTYFQMHNRDGWKSIYIDNLKQGDKIRLTTNPTKQCAIWSNNTSLGNQHRFTTTTDVPYVEFTVTSDGSVQIQCIAQYAGIHTIELYVDPDYEVIEPRDPFFNYDPGYEVYDFFEVRDEILDRDNDGNITAGPTDNTQHTDYTVKDADFNLNGNNAQYFTFNDNGLTLNNRIAISQSGRWRFTRGLVVPNSVNDAYFSISNLKKGDRVQIFYLGEAPIFASQEDGTYNGCSAFYDRWNDGDFNPDDGDHFILQNNTNQVEYIATREEGTIRRDEQITQAEATLYSSAVYVITEDGHMDFRLSKNPTYTRIVKVYIWSDHQATMIDDYSERNYQYTSHFDITGELQAKEHIVPGGLEVRIGNEDKSQHAIVVASKEGPVSFVNAVDGFKLPGVTGSVQDGIQINFNLGDNNINNIPTTGTFYKFMPLESGTMKVKFTPYSMYYYRYDIKGNAIYFDEGGRDQNGRNHSAWREEFGRGNEQTVNRACPYYVKVSADNGNTFSDVASTDITWTGGSSELMNGGEGEFVLEVEAGKIYYLFGGWTSGANGDNTNLNNFDFMFIRDINDNKITPHACGVAELFDVAFTPSKQIYPLAKWVPSGTTEDNDLAVVVGYHDTELTVKKMSGNITQCDPYLYETTENGKTIHKLGIRNIQFKDGENPGGVVLIKFGTNVGGSINYYKVDPVYAFTVAYDANYHSTSSYAEELRGHTWDFSSSSLNGLEWDPTTEVPTRTKDINNDNINDVFENITSQNYAEDVSFGTYFNNFFDDGEDSGINQNSFLYGEMDYVDNGVNRSDWMFNYRLQKNLVNYDPRFLNKYDMEGDNADMIWDTEGIVIKAHSNTSCIFNEFGNGDIHSSQKDPDRYVGILSGGSFLIPHLNKDDRVIIYMGSGTDPDEYDIEDMKFHITNARDAEYKLISEDDVYLAGGSQWKGKEGDNNYRGCYHFFAQNDGDMEFTLEGSNSICKLYKIQIYRGDRINTNEVVGETDNDKFLLWSRAADPNDNTGKEIGPTYNWTLNYFGKDQKLADGTNGVNNGIVNYNAYFAKSGANINNNGFTTSTETDPTKATYNTFTYTHDYGQIGTFRMRGKDMEKNMKYVADYGEHNVTVAYQETMPYPYTWDFMDMTGYGNNVQSFVYEDGIGSLMTTKPDWYVNDNPTLWDNSYEKTSTDLSLWEVDSQDGTYYLRLNSQSGQTNSNLKAKDNIFETAKDIDGNQVWANGAVVPETQGLWFYTLNNNRNNYTWGVTNDGLAFNGLSTTIQKVVVPNVPAGAAVYVRMQTDRDAYGHEFMFKGGNTNYKVYGPELVEGTTDEYILAIKNEGAKRHLTLSLAGYQLKKLAVSTDPKSVNIKGYASESRDHAIDAALLPYFTGKKMKSYLVSDPDYKEHTLTLTDVSTSTNSYVIPENTGYVIYNPDNANDTGEFNPFWDGEEETITDKGFHLFVPDMHDQTGKCAVVDTNNEFMVPVLEERTGTNKLMSFSGDGKKTNYVLSYKWYDLKPDGSTTGQQHIGDEMFYRVSKEGINLRANSAYLVLDTKSLGLNTSQGSVQGATQSAKFTFVFSDWSDVPVVPTTIENHGTMETFENGDVEWHNLSGQKLNGKPSVPGLYIVNGKKVLVK